MSKVFTAGRTSPIVIKFREWTGKEPTAKQKKLLQEAITQKYHGILISAGRQSGKSLCSAVIVLYYLYEYEIPVKILMISAQDNMVYMHMQEIIRDNPKLREEFTEAALKGVGVVPIKGFDLKRGSLVNIKNATEKGVFGFPADIVVVDEACKVDNRVIMSALNCITVGNSPVAKKILLSTPDEDNSYFVKWYNDPESGFRKYTWSAEEDNWHSKEQLHLSKITLSTEEYATQILGRPKTLEERAFFAYKNIEECCVYADPEPSGGEKSRLEVGIDHGFNYTVYVLTERLNATTRNTLYYQVWKKNLFTEIAPEIAKLLKRDNPYNTRMDSKPLVDQGQIEKYCNKKIQYIDLSFVELGEDGKPISENGKFVTHKSYMLGQLRSMIKGHKLKIFLPAQQEIVDQLKKYRPKMSTGDDIVDALALSCYEPATPLIERHSMVIGFDNPVNGPIIRLRSGRVINFG